MSIVPIDIFFLSLLPFIVAFCKRAELVSFIMERTAHSMWILACPSRLSAAASKDTSCKVLAIQYIRYAVSRLKGVIEAIQRYMHEPKQVNDYSM